YKHLDLSPILFKAPVSLESALYKQEEQDHGISEVIDHKLIRAAQAAIDQAEPVSASFAISNQDRATGTMLSGRISKAFLAHGLPADTIHYKFTGTAGQSFGAFATKGLTFELEGDANDYLGKGLSGAKLILYPPKVSQF